MISPGSPFARHVHAVQRYTALTAPRYAPLFKSELVTHPICCFGAPTHARIATVGLNLSDGEFHAKRKWPDAEMDHPALADRCSKYFTQEPQAHIWFAPWSEGLNHLHASYEDGSAVHLDLSPRATRSVSNFKTAWEQQLFLQMVERDLWTFFGTLELCSKVQLVIMAGSVTGKFYLNEFLQRHAPDYGYSLDGPFNRLTHPGRAKTVWHTLSGGARPLPVFFCSSSPSDNNKALLPQRIKENANHLQAKIAGVPTDPSK